MVLLSVEGARSALPYPDRRPSRRRSRSRPPCAALPRARARGAPTRRERRAAARCAGRHAAVARARVHGFADGAVALALGKALRPGLLAAAAEGGQHCWRIDRDEASSIFVRLRRSLMGARGRAPRRVQARACHAYALHAASRAAVHEAGRALAARHPCRTLIRLAVQGLRLCTKGMVSGTKVHTGVGCSCGRARARRALCARRCPGAQAAAAGGGPAGARDAARRAGARARRPQRRAAGGRGPARPLPLSIARRQSRRPALQTPPARRLMRMARADDRSRRGIPAVLFMARRIRSLPS